MANYLFVYKGGSGMAPTEAEMKAVMEQWMQWFGSLGPAVVDVGSPFSSSKSVGANGVNDGGASRLTGYSVIKADSLDAAAGMAKKCPILADGGTVEVYESAPM